MRARWPTAGRLFSGWNLAVKAMCPALLVLVAISLASAGCSPPVGGAAVAETASADPDLFSFPAEWEPHGAVWVAWVAPQGRNSERTEIMNAMTVDIIGALRDHVDLEVVVQSEEAAAEVEARLRKILDLLKDTDKMFIINQRVVAILGPNSTVPIAEIDVYQEKLREDIV